MTWKYGTFVLVAKPKNCASPWHRCIPYTISVSSVSNCCRVSSVDFFDTGSGCDISIILRCWLIVSQIHRWDMIIILFWQVIILILRVPVEKKGFVPCLVKTALFLKIKFSPSLGWHFRAGQDPNTNRQHYCTQVNEVRTRCISREWWSLAEAYFFSMPWNVEEPLLTQITSSQSN